MGTIPPRPGLKVFVNRSNLISIEQIDADDPEAPIVVVYPDDVDRLISLLQNARQEAASLPPNDFDDRQDEGP
jgi:hypothetical protein